MASVDSVVVRSAIQSAVRKSPSQSSRRSSNLKKEAQEILIQGSVQEDALDKFSESILTYLGFEVRRVADRYKGTNKKREHVVYVP